MRYKKKKRQIVSAALAAMMAMQLCIPSATFAAVPTKKLKVITGFTELPEEVAHIQIPADAGENFEDYLNFPETIEVTRKQLEVDFVCNLGSSRYYIQSAYSLPDEAKRTQEIRPFRKIDDSFKKIVITKDIVQPYYDNYGILTVNIYDFLLDPQILEK